MASAIAGDGSATTVAVSPSPVLAKIDVVLLRGELIGRKAPDGATRDAKSKITAERTFIFGVLQLYGVSDTNTAKQ